MSLDAVAGRAASALRDSVHTQVDSNLEALYVASRRRSRQRRAGTVMVAAVVAWGVWTAGLWDTPASERRDIPVAVPSFAPLGEGYEVNDVAVSPSGDREAVATLREAQPAVVLLRDAGSTSYDVVWSAPTQHEIGDRNLPWPVAVSWAPDEGKLAILIAQERGRLDEKQNFVDLSLMTVAPDGTGRELIEEVGTCACTDSLPEMAWARDGLIEIELPDGPDRGRYTKEMQ